MNKLNMLILDKCISAILLFDYIICKTWDSLRKCIRHAD